MTNAKNRRITIRFSDEEYEQLAKQAKVNNMEFATYVRERIFFDAPQIEQNSFEFKTLKSISYLVGVLRGLMKSKLSLSDQENKMIDDEILKIMNANGLREDQVKTSKE